MKAEAAALGEGIDADEAMTRAGFGLFGATWSLCGTTDPDHEGIWQDRADFADAFMTWSSYAYGED